MARFSDLAALKIEADPRKDCHYHQWGLLRNEKVSFFQTLVDTAISVFPAVGTYEKISGCLEYLVTRDVYVCSASVMVATIPHSPTEWLREWTPEQPVPIKKSTTPRTTTV